MFIFTRPLQNVLVKVPRRLKQAVADDMRSVFNVFSKKKARKFFYEFKQRNGEKNLHPL